MGNPFEVIATHDTEKMRSLLDSGLNVNKRRLFGDSLIERAMKDRVFNMVMLLYQRGANIESIRDMYDDLFFCDSQANMEAILLTQTSGIIEKYSEDHAKEQVYVFGFEYRYDYGSVIISLNTRAAFESTLLEYRKRYPKEYKSKSSIESLKYNPGDWKYQALKSLTIITSIRQGAFGEALRNVLRRLTENHAFECIHKTADFRHDIWEYD
jgi:hypothetical protein